MPRRLRGALKLLIFVAILIAVNQYLHYFLDMLEMDLRPTNEDMVHRMIMVAAVVYALTLALPFVPGVEIGLALIAIFGPRIVLLVYICTVVGLCLGFLIGRLMPIRVLIGIAHDLGLLRIERFLTGFAGLPPGEIVPTLVSAAPQGWARFLLRNRYVALALLINLPGNVVIGGGGGIAMMAGLSRCFRAPLFFLTVLIAVSPVPLAIAIFGPGFLAE
ncbi:hypothetical protein PGB28_18550 [Primorskyibacter aestuariivivens]|uniref:hypothetical protein n=1 Tax=Primorskyibacter aestuariivivens TaxID=1888912 RepID=UPI002300FC33|nr:hypothetical protein [Primorskyibacter aestuariivivens]MDA7430466.1 hypothetical protein [Primorskyibacter aestuariivivens]